MKPSLSRRHGAPLILLEYKAQHGLTIEQMADALDMPVQRFKQLLYGYSEPRAKLIEQVRRYTGGAVCAGDWVDHRPAVERHMAQRAQVAR